MILDDIEFDALSRADTLLLALLRPRLWSEYLNADALGDAELRDRLQRETARRAAQTANERARFAFERNEVSPFPDDARQTRLDELADVIALESLRARWLQCASTEAGRAQLRIIEGLPMRLNNARFAPDPAWAKISCGLAREFTDETHALDEVGAFVAAYLQRERATWSVTLAPTTIHYASVGSSRAEAGAELGLINDPRAPLPNYALGAPRAAFGRRVTPRVWATSVVPDVARLRRDARRRRRAVAANVSGARWR